MILYHVYYPREVVRVPLGAVANLQDWDNMSTDNAFRSIPSFEGYVWKINTGALHHNLMTNWGWATRTIQCS